jgi:hypothetical protein
VLQFANVIPGSFDLGCVLHSALVPETAVPAFSNRFLTLATPSQTSFPVLTLPTTHCSPCETSLTWTLNSLVSVSTSTSCRSTSQSVPSLSTTGMVNTEHTSTRIGHRTTPTGTTPHLKTLLHKARTPTTRLLSAVFKTEYSALNSRTITLRLRSSTTPCRTLKRSI